MTRSARLRAVLGANLALVGALVAVGAAAHSLAVWAEGADYLADAAAVGVTLLAIHLAHRPPTATRPGGFPRATRYAALVNAGWLLVVTLLVAAGAVERLATGTPDVHGLPVLVASGVAAVVMWGGALLLGGDADGDGFDDGIAGGEGVGTGDEEREEAGAAGASHERLSVQAVLLDTAADAAAAGGVAVAGAVMFVAHGLSWLDPVVALAVAVAVGFHATRLLARVRTSLRR
ncbi:MAG: cation diffusion facilitator family transporter [Acidimicrobiales bacterium]